jgi:hypothetical protein
MQEAFGIVIFAVVGISVVLAVVSLFFRGHTYDQIGRGGIGDDREIRPARAAPGGAVDLGERDDEIRQMLAARNARHAARGEAALDVEAELARLTAPAVDPALRQEIRELVIARNSRREAKGQPPLDVDSEVERQVRDLGG